jgi:hypothetical protein
MRDASLTLFRASRTAPRAAVAVILLTIACALGGCAGGGAASASFAMAGAGGNPTVAFESIDGPPPQVFDRMVSVLDSESKLRNLSIVSREGSASYRVRSYLSAQVGRGRNATIAWVWDVYDRGQQRALRLSGEEPAGKAGRDPPWSTEPRRRMRRRLRRANTAPRWRARNRPCPPQPNPAPARSATATADARKLSAEC